MKKELWKENKVIQLYFYRNITFLKWTTLNLSFRKYN